VVVIQKDVRLCGCDPARCAMVVWLGSSKMCGCVVVIQKDVRLCGCDTARCAVRAGVSVR